MIGKEESLAKVGFGIAVMFGAYWTYSIFIQGTLNITPMLKGMIGFVFLYGVGLFLFMSVIKTIPSVKMKARRISMNTFLKCFLLQFTAFTALLVMSIMVSKVTGNETNSNLIAITPYTVFESLILCPIVEELVFRKLFADKLLNYGEWLYIIASSFCFAIVHGVSIGLPQIAYTLILGLIWSYAVVITGNIIIPIILHSLSNLFGDIILQALRGISMELLGVYAACMVLLGVIGFTLLIRDRSKIVIDNRNELVDKDTLKEIFTNKGIVFCVVLTIAAIMLKNVI
jgi:membrane protease YdiL (CAAX protease family)